MKSMCKSFIFCMVLLTVQPLLWGVPFEVWVETFGATLLDEKTAADIAVDDNGNVFVAGVSEGMRSKKDYLLIKYNKDGNQLWTRRYGNWTSVPPLIIGLNDYAYAVAVDNADGSVYITGKSYNSSGNYDIVTIKYDTDGNRLWQDRYDGSDELDDCGNDIAVDYSGHVFVAGYTEDDTNGKDLIAIRYNADGSSRLTKKYNGPADDDDEANKIAVDSNGCPYLTGYSTNTGGNKDYFTVKYMHNLAAELWSAVYNGPGEDTDEALDIIVADDYYCYITGKSWGSNSIYYDSCTIKYSLGGNEQWVSRYNGSNSYDIGQAIALGPDNDVYITGYSYSLNSHYDILTIMYDNASGNENWVRLFDGAGSYWDKGKDIAVDAYGNAYVTGYTYADDNDYTTLKYDDSGNLIWDAFYNGAVNSSDIAVAIALYQPSSILPATLFVTGNTETNPAQTAITTIRYDQTAVSVNTNPLTPFFRTWNSHFAYERILSNKTGQTQTFYFWSQLKLPNGEWAAEMPVEPVLITLEPGEVKQLDIKHNIPQGSAQGKYEYRGYIGTGSGEKKDSDMFMFYVTVD